MPAILSKLLQDQSFSVRSQPIMISGKFVASPRLILAPLSAHYAHRQSHTHTVELLRSMAGPSLRDSGSPA